MDQLNILDALATLNPTIVAEMTAEPGWVWAQCAGCGEFRYQRRAADLGRCRLTPRCTGRMGIYLELTCLSCGRPVSMRRRSLNLEFCSKKCEKGAAA